MDGTGPRLLAEAAGRQRVLGTKEFYLAPEEMVALLQHVLRRTTLPCLSLNRPQAGGTRLVHRLDWEGLRFVSVSVRPLLVV